MTLNPVAGFTLMSRNVEGPWYWTGRDQWYCTINGKQSRLGVRGRKNRASAVEAWGKLMAGGSTSTTPPNTNPPEINSSTNTPAPTVQEVIDAFQADIKTRLKPNTVRMYGTYLDRFKVAIGERRVSELRPPEIHQWVRQQGTSATTHKLALQPLSTCLEWAMKCEMIDRNPAARVPKPRTKSRSTAGYGMRASSCTVSAVRFIGSGGVTKRAGTRRQPNSSTSPG